MNRQTGAVLAAATATALIAAVAASTAGAIRIDDAPLPE
jgi:hypothetical protein